MSEERIRIEIEAERSETGLEILRDRRTWRDWFYTVPGFSVSLLVHVVLLLILLQIYFPISLFTAKEIISFPGLSDNDGELEFLGDPGSGDVNLSVDSNDQPEVDDTNTLADSVNPVLSASSGEVSPSAVSVALNDETPGNVRLDTHFTVSGSSIMNSLSGRGDAKGILLSQNGGSEGSEKAVALGLTWLAQHQNSDGSWSYDFTKHPKCKGKCGNPGRSPSVNSATSLALLPFLGTGVTHKQGKKEYQVVVDKGLKFLLKNSKMTPNGLSFIDIEDMSGDGGMYHQGIASIVICEAAAMSDDPVLKNAAQEAAKFICYAQIPSDGGWRYAPRDKTGGDTSVLGWQIMALKSAQMGGVNVPDTVFAKARNFLDNSVSSDNGAKYIYKKGSDQQEVRATTAIGLLSKMYMGTPVTDPALVRGVDFLSESGPDKKNLYYDYYATQVLHHYGGEEWHRWNREFRDDLIAAQETSGHERGSWFCKGQWNGTGGRLYTTALSVLMLEVYYRYLPLYKSQSVNDDFILD
ncbi:MAG: prenyltransferase/squalene oxidase repeat-containing protein [Thermoguttaceae bacterium]